MEPRPLSLDTSLEVERIQIERWRRMSPGEKLAMGVAISQSVRNLALADIRQRHPCASPREQFLRLAVLTLGPDLARRAFPESEGLEP